MTKLLEVVGQRVTHVQSPEQRTDERIPRGFFSEESLVLQWPICWDFLSESVAAPLEDPMDADERIEPLELYDCAI